MNTSQFKILRSVGIRHFDDLIHDQKKEWLIQNFKKGATDYPINVTKLIRNIIWQQRERIVKGEKKHLKELIRTFWYMYIKPVLYRAGALSRTRDQYADLITNLVTLVVNKKLMNYSDIGFRDDNKANRQIGINANIIVFAEKIGHQDFLSEIAQQYSVTVIAHGGQPSALSTEYFVSELKNKGVNIQRSFYLFSIVDYDPSGWIIRDAFINNLKAFGIKNIRCYDLINPDMLTQEEIEMSKFRIPDTKTMHKKNTAWMKQIKKAGYTNQKYLAPELISAKKKQYKYFGLESEAVSSKRIAAKLETEMLPLLGKSERLLKIFQLERLNQNIKDLMILKLT